MKLLTLSFWSAASMATSSFVPVDLPPDLPKRAPGLWEIRTQGTLSGGPIPLYEERSQICLDATVDQALYGVDIDAKYLTITTMAGNCDAPVYAFDGKSLNMTMQCTRKGGANDTVAATAFTSHTTYLSANQVNIEHKRIDKDHTAAQEELIYSETMTRIGECAPEEKVGDRIRLDSQIDGSEIQKFMWKDNIFHASRKRQKIMEDILARHREIIEAGSDSP